VPAAREIRTATPDDVESIRGILAAHGNDGPVAHADIVDPYVVTATLLSGTVSVTPSGGVLAPATFLGTKCGGPNGDWVEELVTSSLGMAQRWVFTIDGTTLKGTYTFDATQTFPDGSGTWHGTGEASVTILPDGPAEMRVTGGKTTITTKTSGGTASQSMPGPGGQHSVWMPAGDACR
jgi:hypothetical protein